METEDDRNEIVVPDEEAKGRAGGEDGDGKKKEEEESDIPRSEESPPDTPEIVVTLNLSRAAVFYRSARFAGLKKLPDGVELTLSELQDMAARQQQQIESQQQMLVAKEQRLKFLKQQEMQQQQTPSENERLRRLREKVEAQELKLRKLRALRGQVDQQKMSNSSLTSELESIRALFNEKEKELSIAVAKVDELTQQLEELRRGRLNNHVLGGNSATTVIELDKLRRELLYRNKLNEQQNNKLAQQREALTRGQEEMNRIDRRIAELQQRLHRKRLLNQQLANQINAAATAKQVQLRSNHPRSRLRPLSANVAAVEPYKHMPQEVPKVPLSVQPGSQDDLHPKLSIAKSEDLPEFQPNKNDPKYQTLPVNTKFSVKFNKGESQINQNQDLKLETKQSESVASPASKKQEDKSHIIPNSNNNSVPNGKIPPTHTVHSIPAYTPPKSHATPLQTNQQQTSPLTMAPAKQNLVNLAPKPYGSTYSSSLLSSTGPLANRSHPAVGSGPGSPGNSAPKYVPPPPPPPISNSSALTSSSSSPSLFRETVNLPNTPLTTAAVEKPISSVPPTTLQQAKSASGGSQSRPSTIYQTSSTRVAQVTPHTLSTTPQGILKEVEDLHLSVNASNVTQGQVNMKAIPASTLKTNVTVPLYARGSSSANCSNSADHNSVQNASAANETQDQLNSSASDSSLTSKPSLPPKPTVPQKPTPPPRQIHALTGDKTKIDTSPDSVDSALNILRGNQATKANGSYSRYASRNVIAESYVQKLGNGILNQYCRNTSQHTREGDSDMPLNGNSQNENSSALVTSIEEEFENTSKKPSSNDLPIKPKPLTIKKHSGLDPPKLKVMTNGTNSHRKTSPPLENNISHISNGNNLVTTNNNINNSGFPVNNENVNSNNSATVNSRVTPSVHISINRRIEMPPAFLFPETEAPPPDLNAIGRELTSANASNTTVEHAQTDVTDNVVKIPPPPPPPLCPPPYPGIRSDKAWELKTLSDQSKYLANEISNSEESGTLENNSSIKIVDSDGTGIHQESAKLPQPPTDVGDEKLQDHLKAPEEMLMANSLNGTNGEEESLSGNSSDGQPTNAAGMIRRAQKGNLKTKGSTKSVRRVSFDPLALLLDASLEGELELVKKTAKEVSNPSAANDEGITALHNAICAGHYEIVRFLVEFGCDVNAQDSDGWTPLHCAASCNNLPMVKFLVEHGACIFATTLSDHETAAEKCEEDEEGFDGCSEYLYSIQEKLGILNNGAVYALYDYEAQNPDEIGFKDGETIIVLRKGDEFEREWWWSRIKNKEGYIPRNLLGLYPRVGISKNQ